MDFNTNKENLVKTPSKKTFKRPEVKLFGSIEDITRGPNGGSIDGLFGGTGGFQTIPNVS